ncbi:hypothetical protein V3C99_006995 [Haemonchus contortus]
MIALLLLDLITPSLACLGGLSGGSGGSRCCQCCQQPSAVSCDGGACFPAMCSPMGTGGMGGVGILEGLGRLLGLGGLLGLQGLLEPAPKVMLLSASSPSIRALPPPAPLQLPPPTPETSPPLRLTRSPVSRPLPQVIAYPEPMKTGYSGFKRPPPSMVGTSEIGKEDYISPQINMPVARTAGSCGTTNTECADTHTSATATRTYYGTNRTALTHMKTK